MSSVVVTGAASGIGRACAEALVADGRRVALWDVEPAVADVADAMEVPSAVVDVCGSRAIEAVVAEADSALNGIDGLVHAAGRVLPEPVAAYSEDSWDAILDVNLRAHAILAQLMLPQLQMSAREGGTPAIVGISSIEGLAANPFIPAYCASTAGPLGLTLSMAAQLGVDGIRANAVCPGIIRTPMLQVALDIEEVRAGFEHATPSRDKRRKIHTTAHLRARALALPRTPRGILI
jgi:NAD(P)-dependent dehydrogenase (short-subunit alcohol dehydrogenase family)